MTSTQTLDRLGPQIQALAADFADRQTRFLADLVSIRSYTGQERPAVERTLQELRTIGCEEVGLDSAGNALGRIGHGPRVLLYDAHLDTNEVADESEWPHPPLEPVIENGALWGLGASDCKGGVATIVYGAAILGEILKAHDLADDFTVWVMGATLEEDAEGFALRALVERDGLRPEAVLLAEATDLTLRRGQRGRCEVRVRTAGKAAHASQPHLGDSALLKMLPVIAALDEMAPSLPHHAIFGQGTQAVTLIEGPHTPNSVPSWCEIALDRRIVPGETPESVLKSIQSIAAPLGGSARISEQPVRSHTGLKLDGPAFFPGWYLEDGHPLLEAGSRTCASLWGTAPKVDVWHFSTDGTYSAGAAGIPTLGFGPQEERFVHAADDQVDLRKLQQATAFYALFPFIYCQEE
jgi:putative selenium metabolism hydrolase